MRASNISVLYKYKVAEPLYPTIGLKEGDILSTIFYNLFINDLPSFLADPINENNEKLKLRDTNISPLLFADDL